MKKLIAIFLSLIFCAFCGCTLNAEKQTKNLTSYTANITYDDLSHTISGTMAVNFTNHNNSALDELEFNIYANAFRENSNQSVISLSKSEECYYNGASYGKIDIQNVYDEQNLQYSICGVDENVLKVELESPVQPESSTNVNIDFIVTIPNINHRLGYGENTINIGNFLPTLCVYENGKWIEIEYNSNGDPFFSEVANYDIIFSYPSQFAIASTGYEVSSQETNGVTTKNLYAPSVRDFAIVLSNKFEKVSSKIDEITVNYFYYDDDNFESNLRTAVNAVKTFNNLFGKYPYKELNIVKSNFCIGGMEFPNLVLIGDFIQEKESYEMVIVHEIAHQWWYGVVGNNQSEFAWLDESLAEFSTALFYEKNDNYAYSYDLIMNTANTNLQIFQNIYTDVLGKANLSMNRNLNDFSSENEYIFSTYTQGMLMFDSLAKLIGEKTVIKCLRDYFITYAFDISTPDKLIASFEKTTSCNLEPFFRSWIDGKVVFSN